MINLYQRTYTGLPRAAVSYEVKLLHSICFIILYDLDAQRSLLNDAQAVIEDLLYIYPGAKSAVIIYRDPDGCFDFIIPDINSDKVFFKSIGSLSEENTINWWLHVNTSMYNKNKVVHE